MSEVFYQQQPTAIWNSARGVWEKQGMVNLLCEHLALFSETWHQSGMMLGGKVYELPTQAHHTTVSESLSSPTLATPKARDWQAEGYQAGLRRSQPQLGTQMRAMMEASAVPEDSLLRTPSAIEGQGGAISEKQSREKGRMLQVRDQMVQLAAENGLKVSAGVADSLLPTPTTQDNSGRCRDHGGDLLHELVCGCPRAERKQDELMPTPTVFHVSMHDEPIETFLAREERSSTGQLGKSLGVALRMEMMPTPKALDGVKGNLKTTQQRKDAGHFVDLTNVANDLATETSWGKFKPAIKRWEEILGRPAPAPTNPDGKDGNHRLSSKFTEWMMGVPEGWITSAGLSRNDELKACGNGVVPQQAEMALRILLEGIDLETQA